VLQEQSTLPVKNVKRMHENVRLFDEATKAERLVCASFQGQGSRIQRWSLPFHGPSNATDKPDRAIQLSKSKSPAHDGR
jgi:hypothetical protein